MPYNAFFNTFVPTAQNNPTSLMSGLQRLRDLYQNQITTDQMQNQRLAAQRNTLSLMYSPVQPIQQQPFLPSQAPQMPTNYNQPVMQPPAQNYQPVMQPQTQNYQPQQQVVPSFQKSPVQLQQPETASYSGNLQTQNRFLQGYTPYNFNQTVTPW